MWVHYLLYKQGVIISHRYSGYVWALFFPYSPSPLEDMKKGMCQGWVYLLLAWVLLSKMRRWAVVMRAIFLRGLFFFLFFLGCGGGQGKPV